MNPLNPNNKSSFNKPSTNTSPKNKLPPPLLAHQKITQTEMSPDQTRLTLNQKADHSPRILTTELSPIVHTTAEELKDLVKQHFKNTSPSNTLSSNIKSNKTFLPPLNKPADSPSTETVNSISDQEASLSGIRSTSTLSFMLDDDTSIAEHQNAFQNDVLLQIGEHLALPIASCTGSNFLNKVQLGYSNRRSNPSPLLTSLSRLSVSSNPLDVKLCSGFSNSYLLRAPMPNGKTENLAIVKPALENFKNELTTFWEDIPVQRTGIPYTQLVRNEWLGSILSELYAQSFDDLDFKVPETHIITIPASNFSDLRNNNMARLNQDMICSIQEFAPNTTNLASLDKNFLQTIPSPEIAKIAILDILLYNTDRKRHNLLIQEGTTLIPIDHSLIASSGFQDNAHFFWLNEASSTIPFTKQHLKGIHNLNWEYIKNQLLIENPNLDIKTLNTLNTSLEFLKIGASLGMTPFEIGSLMFRKGETFGDGSHTEHFAQHCYNSALLMEGDFSKNIQDEIKKYLTPCAKLLRDPQYETLNEIPLQLEAGFRTPLLQAMMTALEKHDGTELSFKTQLEQEITKLIKT